MITVAILINGNPIMARSATQERERRDGVCEYRCDDGSVIEHDPDDGAVALAHKLLNTIRE
jgi:hypothetical protein